MAKEKVTEPEREDIVEGFVDETCSAVIADNCQHSAMLRPDYAKFALITKNILGMKKALGVMHIINKTMSDDDTYVIDNVHDDASQLSVRLEKVDFMNDDDYLKLKNASPRKIMTEIRHRIICHRKTGWSVLATLIMLAIPAQTFDWIVKGFDYMFSYIFANLGLQNYGAILITKIVLLAIIIGLIWVNPIKNWMTKSHLTHRN